MNYGECFCWWRVILFLPVGLFFLISCAGTPLTKVGGGSGLPSELSQEFKDKFEVKDMPTTPAPAPAPAPSVTLASSTELKKGEKSKKQPKVQKKQPDPNDVKIEAPKPESTIVPTQSSANGFVYPNRRPKNDPIWIGEELTYDVSYFGVAAGSFVLTVLPHKAINNRKVYHVKGTATSSKLFSMFYRLNDTVETFFDYESLFSHRLHLVLDETKQTRDSLELNDPEKAQTFYWNRWNHKTKGYIEVKQFAEIPRFAQDTLSALYYLRTVPLPNGAVATVPIVSESKHFEAVVTVLRRETVDSPLGDVQAIVVKPETKYQGVLKKQGDSFIWLSDDERRFVLRLEAKVRIGTVVAKLKKVSVGSPP